MKRAATAAEKRHLEAVASLGCCVCGKPAQVHHLLGLGYRCTGKKADHHATIPLCPMHHTEGGFGVAIHAGVRTWEAKFGTQSEHLKKTLARVARSALG